MSGHHCPRILGSRRIGYWFECRCGATGKSFTGRRGASLDWALHVRDRAVRKGRIAA